jgi:hypothetical protein
VKLDNHGVYQWHTFYGSISGYDYGKAIALDGNDNIYVAGYSSATWRGAGGATPLHAHSGSTCWDIVVLKLNSSGAYQWHTFYGADTSNDLANGIALDGSGGVYVAGYGDGTWQGDGGVNPLHAHSGGWELAVLKLNSSGAYQWHTFYGAASGDGFGHAIAMDGNGNIYVAGESTATWQGDGNANPIRAFQGGYDIVVLKLNSSGVYQWHTFYGSVSGWDEGYAIAVDGSGNVYVAGHSTDSWKGDSNTNPLHAYSGTYYNIVVVKLNSSGTYQWHTFYGSGYDESYGIALDGRGSIYVVGYSYDTWQGNGGANPLHPFSGGTDIVTLKLTSNGAYQWHTFYGSSRLDFGQAVALDKVGNVYVAGESQASWQGDGNADPLHVYSGDYDIVALKLNSISIYLPIVIR